MKRTRLEAAATCSLATVRTLVLSQHEVVRRQLVAYLGRSPELAVAGEPVTPEAIINARPDVLVLDLSQLGPDGLRIAIDAAQRVEARMIALASIREPADEHVVSERGWTPTAARNRPGQTAWREIVKDVAAQSRSVARSGIDGATC